MNSKDGFESTLPKRKAKTNENKVIEILEERITKKKVLRFIKNNKKLTICFLRNILKDGETPLLIDDLLEEEFIVKIYEECEKNKKSNKYKSPKEILTTIFCDIHILFICHDTYYTIYENGFKSKLF